MNFNGLESVISREMQDRLYKAGIEIPSPRVVMFPVRKWRNLIGIVGVGMNDVINK